MEALLPGQKRLQARTVRVMPSTATWRRRAETVCGALLRHGVECYAERFDVGEGGFGVVRKTGGGGWFGGFGLACDGGSDFGGRDGGSGYVRRIHGRQVIPAVSLRGAYHSPSCRHAPAVRHLRGSGEQEGVRCPASGPVPPPGLPRRWDRTDIRNGVEFFSLAVLSGFAGQSGQTAAGSRTAFCVSP